MRQSRSRLRPPRWSSRGELRTRRALGVDAVVARRSTGAPASVDAAIRRTVEEILADGARARRRRPASSCTAALDDFGCGSARGAARPAGRASTRPSSQRGRGHAGGAALRGRAHRGASPGGHAAQPWSHDRRRTARVLGQEVRPLERVGIYVPGGRAAYPSTVLMTAVPARVAGVARDRARHAARPRRRVLNAGGAGRRARGGVTEAYRIGRRAGGGARWPTARATIRRVDKIVGPGNIYVALAKSRVFGDVGIDMAGGAERGRGDRRRGRRPGLCRRRSPRPGRARSDGARRLLTRPSAALLDSVEAETRRAG